MSIPHAIRHTIRLAIVVLAIFATSCGGSTPEDDTAIASDSPEPTSTSAVATATPDPTATVEVATATPIPEPTATAAATATPAPEPTATAQPELTAEDRAARAGLLYAERGLGYDLSADELACAVSALADDVELFGRVYASGDDFQQLSDDDQVDAAMIAFDCAPGMIAEGFAQGFSDGGASGAAMPPEVTECFIATVGPDVPNRRAVIEGWVLLGQGRQVPQVNQTALVDTLVECLPGRIFGSMVADAALEDGVEDAIDIDCMSDNLDGETMRPMWTAMMTQPTAGFDTFDPAVFEPVFEAMFSCVSFGRIIAAEAAADGITLSEATISCIDDSLGETDLAPLIAGDGDQAAASALVLGCLSEDELAQLFG